MSSVSYTQKQAEIEAEPIWAQLEGDRPCKDQRVWSASSIRTAMTCPFQYHLRFNLRSEPEFRRPQAFRGSRLHESIHRLHRDQAWDDYGDLWAEVWDRGIAEKDVPWIGDDDDTAKQEEVAKKIEDAKLDGLSILGNYVMLNRKSRVLRTEVPWRMVLEHPRTKTRYRFSGTIDQIREPEEAQMHNATPGILVPQKDRVFEVWDPKSNAQAPAQEILNRDVQFSIYGLALREAIFLWGDQRVKFSTPPQRMVWYQLQYLLPYKRSGKWGREGDMRGDPVIPTTRSEQELDFARNESMRVIQMVRMNLFFRNIGKWTCGTLCDHVQACTTGVLNRREDVADLGDFSGL